MPSITVSSGNRSCAMPRSCRRRSKWDGAKSISINPVRTGYSAIADAGIEYSEIEEAFLAYCYGDSTTGQRALYELGLSGIPAINVNNNCSTGSSALFLARQAVAAGATATPRSR